MNHIRNALAGFGEAINAFGISPQYTYPSRRGTMLDAKRISGDWKRVGADLKEQTTKALKDGKSVNNR